MYRSLMLLLCLFVPLMPLSANDFTLEYENPKLRAAGTLLYAVNPEDNQVYVLLAQEAFGASANQWKGFGGAQDPGETLIETALRETKEESRGTIDLTPTTNNIIVCEHYRCRYLQLMLEVEYDSSLPERFLQITSDDWTYLEKIQMRWVPLETLLELLEQTHLLALEKNCRARLLKEKLFLCHEGEKFEMAKDFMETELILYRQAPEVYEQLLSGSFTTEEPLLVSDLK